ncbi:MAG: hypothetical protein IPJ69_00870 [Deltaproteobacteria bacterium]|nr:MAG: hypothetical protein IPJ69_00870 [Deltaproteobacteria bacterium]
MIQNFSENVKRPRGRAVKNRRSTVDQVISIDSLRFFKEGYFSNPQSEGTLEWSFNGERVLGISYSRILTTGNLDVIRVNFGGDPQVLYDIPAVPTKCNFGGVRPWFLCPYPKDGKPCYKRVRYLYLPYSNSKIFCCRQCADLTHVSSQRSKSPASRGLLSMNRLLDLQDRISRTRNEERKKHLMKKLDFELDHIEKMNLFLIKGINRFKGKEKQA